MGSPVSRIDGCFIVCVCEWMFLFEAVDLVKMVFLIVL